MILLDDEDQEDEEDAYEAPTAPGECPYSDCPEPRSPSWEFFVLALLMDGSQSEITGRAVIDCIRRVWLLLRIVKKIWTIELGLLKKRLTILGIIFGLK